MTGDVVIVDDTIRIRGETLRDLERLAVMLGVDPREALETAMRVALEGRDR